MTSEEQEKEILRLDEVIYNLKEQIKEKDEIIEAHRWNAEDLCKQRNALRDELNIIRKSLTGRRLF